MESVEKDYPPLQNVIGTIVNCAHGACAFLDSSLRWNDKYSFSFAHLACPPVSRLAAAFY